MALSASSLPITQISQKTTHNVLSYSANKYIDKHTSKIILTRQPVTEAVISQTSATLHTVAEVITQNISI